MPRKAQPKKADKKTKNVNTAKTKKTKSKPETKTAKKAIKKITLPYDKEDYKSILKYLSESQDASSTKRIQKAFSQTLFLLNQTVSENKIEYAVLGSSRKVYHVLISNDVVCNCIDYKIRAAVCKHQIFVLAKVLRSAHSVDVLKKLLEDKIIDIDTVKILEGARELAGSIKGDDETVRNYRAIYGVSESAENVVRREFINEECSICFDGMAAKQKITWCKFCCGSNFHEACIDMWFSAKSDSNKRCPLCRNAWGGTETEGVLSKKRLATL